MKAIVPVMLALVVSGVEAQEPLPTPPQAIPIGTELGSVTAWSLGARFEVTPWLDGEGLAYLDAGNGPAISLGVEFVDRYAADLVVGHSRLGDDFTGGTASIVHALLSISRFWMFDAVDVGLGAGIGVGRLNRDVFAEPNTGLLLAGRAFVRRSVGPRLALDLGAHLHSTSYPTPDLAIPAPSDPDGLALARQIGLSIGLSWVTRRATAEPRSE